MRNENTIHSLESIPKATIYSKYGESLDKLFRSRSLKNLISELKNPKKLITKEYELNEQKPKKKYNKYSEEDFKDIFDSLKSNLNNKIKEEEIKKKNTFEEEKNKPKKLLQNGFNDPFKYNPNYNSISKKVPSVHMILTEKEIKELQQMRERQKSSKFPKKKQNLKKRLPKIKTQIEDSFITQITKEGKENISRINSSKKREQLLPPIMKIPNQRSLTLESDNLRNNHALRFSKYISRKLFFNNNNKLNKVSYLEPYDYLNNKNNIIDFKKMSYRNEKDLINSSSLGVPSIYDYNPKYNLVEKKSAQVVFAPHNDIKNSKLYLLKKLWCSYDLSPEYKLINNNKILIK